MDDRSYDRVLFIQEVSLIKCILNIMLVIVNNMQHLWMEMPFEEIRLRKFVREGAREELDDY